ncbi:RNA-processing protein [Candidatus Micrarchaeota archaeon]|nr:RNA-processing protein [Candidatus Micrarchaeota archaeon]
MMEILKIPKMRVSALVGKEGKTKKIIEEKGNVKINVDEDGVVEIEGEGSDVYFCKDVIKAIGCGFEAGEAIRLLSDNFSFHLINLKEAFNTENALRRVKGRIIGEKGKIKIEIEESTEARIKIYRHTVAIIAPNDTIEYTKEAIYKIIEGAKHNTVKNYLYDIKEKIFAERLRG